MFISPSRPWISRWSSHGFCAQVSSSSVVSLSSAALRLWRRHSLCSIEVVG